jgi:multiple sugar transport system substrate-binding protein
MKFIRLVLVVCVVALMAAAFQPTRAADALPEVVKMPEKIADGKDVTITISNLPPETDAVANKQWNEQVDRFEKMYPNVTVKSIEYTYAPDTFAALVAGKQVPTLFRVYMTDPGKYIDAGVAADITKVFEANKLGDIFNKDIINLATKDGKVYGIPFGAYAMGLGYNIKMLEKAGFKAAPKTWDELRDMAKKLTDRDAGVSGFSFINDGGNATGWHFTVLGYTFGAKPEDIIKAEGSDKFSAGFGEGPMVDALKFIKDLRWTDDVLPRDTLDWATNGAGLATGKAAMILMAGDQYNWIKGSFKDTKMEDFGFAPLPEGPGGIASLVGGDMTMVSSAATPEEQEAAIYFQLWKQFDPTEVKSALDAQKANPDAVIGGPNLPMYVGDYEAAKVAFETPYYNLPTENYAPFLEAVTSGKVKLQVEPSPAGQDYYAAVGTAVSTILTDEGADPAAILGEAAKTFQGTVLDHLAAKK